MIFFRKFIFESFYEKPYFNSYLSSSRLFELFSVKVLNVNGQFLRDIRSEGIKGGSTVGMTILPSGDILTLNWRTKELYRCDPSGELLQVPFLFISSTIHCLFLNNIVSDNLIIDHEFYRICGTC